MGYTPTKAYKLRGNGINQEMGKYFGTYGIRGEAGITLTAQG